LYPKIRTRVQNFAEILRNSLISAQDEIGPFAFKNLGPFKMDRVPIDKAAEAHSIAIPNSPKYAVGSTGFHFSSPRTHSAAAAAAACSVQPRLSSSACAWQGEESWAQQYNLLAPDSRLRPVCLQACEGLREDESTQLDAGAQRCHLHFLLGMPSAISSSYIFYLVCYPGDNVV